MVIVIPSRIALEFIPQIFIEDTVEERRATEFTRARSRLDEYGCVAELRNSVGDKVNSPRGELRLVLALDL